MENKPLFNTTQTIFTVDELETMLRDYFHRTDNLNLIEVMEFAKKAHEGQFRKNSNLPYIIHPYAVCYHAIAMGIENEKVLSACLLHDVVEDCDVKPEELPGPEGTAELVCMLSHGSKDDIEGMKAYFKKIAENPDAALIKCLDRVNNLTTFVWGMTKKGQIYYIRETEDSILPLLDVLAKTKEYAGAAWLMKYQMCSQLDTVKRMM